MAVVSPDFLERVEIEVENLETDNTKTATNGFVGKTSGISLYLSNNIHTESEKEHIYVMTRRAVAHASQINEEMCIRDRYTHKAKQRVRQRRFPKRARRGRTAGTPGLAAHSLMARR